LTKFSKQVLDVNKAASSLKITGERSVVFIITKLGTTLAELTFKNHSFDCGLDKLGPYSRRNGSLLLDFSKKDSFHKLLNNWWTLGKIKLAFKR
jgi:hypothetical protein